MLIPLFSYIFAKIKAVQTEPDGFIARKHKASSAIFSTLVLSRSDPRSVAASSYNLSLIPSSSRIGESSFRIRLFD
jgi:hypothetical protein